jgi:hypothetical protein
LRGDVFVACSRAMAGALTAEVLDTKTDGNGTTFLQVRGWLAGVGVCVWVAH